MIATDLPAVLSYRFAVVQEGRGQPGIGLTLHLLLRTAAGSETTFFLQLRPHHVWPLRDACISLATACPERYAAFRAKAQASHQLNYGQKFLNTLPAGDPYACFHRRQQELAIPLDFRTTLQAEHTGIPGELTQLRGGLALRCAMSRGARFACLLPHDLAFLLVDSIDQAVWAAEWERDGLADQAGG